MTFEESTNLVLESCLAIFGEAAFYLPAGQNKKTEKIPLRVVFDQTFQMLDVDTGTMVQSTQSRAGFKRDAITCEPRTGDQLLVRNKNYRIVESQPDGQGGVDVLLMLINT